MPTPHNEAKKGEIAPVVIMPGDPLRAQAIAKKYLEKPKLVNSIRGMYAYTGTYNGKKVTIMGHGMGLASAGIYFYELFKVYNVKKIIRIGSCGALKEGIDLLDTIIVDKSYTESNYSLTYNNEKVNWGESTQSLTNKIAKIAEKENIKTIRGNVITSECFDLYMPNPQKFYERTPKKGNFLACEMESFVLFYIAKFLNKESACILTVTDSQYCRNVVSAKDRQNSMNTMVELALKSI